MSIIFFFTHVSVIYFLIFFFFHPLTIRICVYASRFLGPLQWLHFLFTLILYFSLLLLCCLSIYFPSWMPPLTSCLPRKLAKRRDCRHLLLLPAFTMINITPQSHGIRTPRRTSSCPDVRFQVLSYYFLFFFFFNSFLSLPFHFNSPIHLSTSGSSIFSYSLYLFVFRWNCIHIYVYTTQNFFLSRGKWASYPTDGEND